MPDTIVPVVRRPVRRVSATPDPKELAGEVRKLSLGEESSRSTERLRRTWDAETGRMVTESVRKSPLASPEVEGREEVVTRRPEVVAKKEEVVMKKEEVATRKVWNATLGKMVPESVSERRPSSQEAEAKAAPEKRRSWVAPPPEPSAWPVTVPSSARQEQEEDLVAAEVGRTAYSGFPAGDKANISLPVARNRPIKTSKDLELERMLLKWLEMVAGKKPSAESFERWIQDGTVLAKAMVSVCFNSVPMEMVNCNWGASPVRDRVKCVIHEMRRFGVSEMFEPEDLMELRNIPRVSKSLARLCRLAAADSKSEDLKKVARDLPFF